MPDGSQYDPYLISTFAQLKEKAFEEGKYLKLVNSINMNDEYPDGIDEEFTVRCAEIDGDGYAISNIRVKPGVSNLYSFMTVYREMNIKNVKFKNIYLTDGQWLIGVSVSTAVHWAGPTFINCTFSGSLYCASSSAITYLTYGNCWFLKSSFNIYFYGDYTTTQPSSSSDFLCKYEECDINFHKESSSQYAHMNLINSNVTGQVEGLNLVSDNSYSIIDATINSLYKSGNVTLVLYNTNKVSWAASGFTGVSDTNLGSTEYLVALGFPIQVNSVDNGE